MKNKFTPVLLGAGAGAVAVLLMQMPILGLASMAIPAVVAVAFGWVSLAACLLTATIALVILLGVEGLANVAMFALTALIARYAVKNYKPFEAALLCCVGVLLSIWVFFGASYAITGQNYIDYFYKELPQSYAATMTAVLEQAGFSGLDITESDIAGMMRTMVPAVGVILSFFIGLAQFLPCVYIGRKFKAKVTSLPEFALWRLPNSFMWALLLMLLLGYIGVLASWDGFEAVMYAVQSLFSLTLGLVGLSVIAFLFRAYDKPAIIVMAVASVIFFALMPLTIVGVVDSAFGIRARYLFQHGSLPNRRKEPPRYENIDGNQNGKGTGQ